MDGNFVGFILKPLTVDNVDRPLFVKALILINCNYYNLALILAFILFVLQLQKLYLKQFQFVN